MARRVESLDLLEELEKWKESVVNWSKKGKTDYDSSTRCLSHSLSSSLFLFQAPTSFHRSPTSDYGNQM